MQSVMTWVTIMETIMDGRLSGWTTALSLHPPPSLAMACTAPLALDSAATLHAVPSKGTTQQLPYFQLLEFADAPHPGLDVLLGNS